MAAVTAGDSGQDGVITPEDLPGALPEYAPAPTPAAPVPAESSAANASKCNQDVPGASSVPAPVPAAPMPEQSPAADASKCDQDVPGASSVPAPVPLPASALAAPIPARFQADALAAAPNDALAALGARLEEIGQALVNYARDSTPLPGLAALPSAADVPTSTGRSPGNNQTGFSLTSPEDAPPTPKQEQRTTARNKSQGVLTRTATFTGTPNNYKVAGHWAEMVEAELESDEDGCGRESLGLHSDLSFSEIDPETGAGSFDSQRKRGTQRSLQRVRRLKIFAQRSKHRLCWDVLGFACTSFDLIWTPMLLLSLPDIPEIQPLIWIVRCYWTLDIPMTFRTAFALKDGTLEMDPLKVARHYARGWLPFDLLLVSMDWFEFLLSTLAWGQVGRFGRIMRILRLTRLLRLSRIIKLNGIIDKLFEDSGLLDKVMEDTATFWAIAKSIAILLVSAHLMACFWHFLGFSADHVPTAERTWAIEGGYVERGLMEQYLCSLHWAMTNFLGEGTVVAQNSEEHLCAVIVLLFTFITSAIFVSYMTTNMTRRQSLDIERQQQLAQLNRYLRSHAISRRLTVRVRRSAQSVLEHRQSKIPEQDVDLLQVLSEPLRVDIHFEVFGVGLRPHPLFEHWCDNSALAMKQVCHKAISLKMVSRGDVLFQAGEREQNPCMLIIYRGCLTYYSDHTLPTMLQAKSWVAEMVLWMPWQHKGGLRADVECEMFAIDARLFQEVAGSSFPLGNGTHPAYYAQWFVDRLNDVESEDLTDLDLGFKTSSWVADQVTSRPRKKSLVENFSPL